MLEHAGIKCMLNELSSTVVFERPKDESFVRKWQLACEVRGNVTTSLSIVARAALLCSPLIRHLLCCASPSVLRRTGSQLECQEAWAQDTLWKHPHARSPTTAVQRS